MLERRSRLRQSRVALNVRQMIMEIAAFVKRIWFRTWALIKSCGSTAWGNLVYLSRALGLYSLHHFLRDHHKPEPPKPVLKQSFWIALSRCGVHLFPITVFSWLLFINCRGIYIGPGFSVQDRLDGVYLALFQIAAKCQEMLCLASLATLLLEFLRHDLLYGEGIPLSFLPSFFWFVQPIALLSPEYVTAVQQICSDLGSILLNSTVRRQMKQSRVVLNWTTIRLVLLLFLLILLSAFIGPFSAVLMLPRVKFYHAGGTQYFLNATAEEVWPDVVTAETELEVCRELNATQYVVCPSGGYGSMQNQRGYKAPYDSNTFKPNYNDDEGIHILNTNYLTLDPSDQVPTMLAVGDSRTGFWPGRTTHMSLPMVYQTIILQMLVRDWRSATDSDAAKAGLLSSVPQYYHAPHVQGVSTSTHALTQVRCSQPQNLSSQGITAQFHFLQSENMSSFGRWSNDTTTKPVDITELHREAASHVRAQWIQLSPDDFGQGSIGMLLELPWSNNSDSRLAISCTAVPSWVSGTTTRASSGAWYVSTFEEASQRALNTDIPPDDTLAQKFARPIRLREDWLNLLTPEAPNVPSMDDGWRPSTLEYVLHTAGLNTMMQDLRANPSFIWTGTACIVGMLNASLTDMELWNARVCAEVDKVAWVERIIAQLISDGLSRRLSYRAFERLPELHSWFPLGVPREEDYGARLLRGNPKRNAVKMDRDSSLLVQSVKFSVEGWGYDISSSVDVIAIVIVGIYLLLSCSHVIWILTHRISSSSWDTALELVLLAFNSPPADQLRGTSAQVHRWDTYKRIVKVRVEDNSSSDQQAESRSHLRLVVDESGPLAIQSDVKDQTIEAATSESVGNSPSTSGLSVNLHTSNPVLGMKVSQLSKVKVDEKYS